MTFLFRTCATWMAFAATAASAGLGCNGGTTVPSSPSSSSPSDPEGTDFISDNPKGSAGRSEGDGNSASSGGGASAPEAGPADDGGAERAIAEADIIQVAGGKLYALSQYSGLSVIDISRRDRLSLLGRYESSGMPFEMYLRDGMVYAMFSSWGQYVYSDSDDSYSWVQTSRIEALDVTDPASIESLGSFSLPGSISDSRIVGDVLYAVSFQDGYCYGCSSTPNTTVTSLAVGDPSAIAVVDQLAYSDSPNGYGWRRSVSVTQDRMYVAGIEWDGSSEGHSTIQVIDISDPGGDLVEGASVEAAGQIQSRWQMDEQDGVLRVVSQPGIWRTNALPAVQTFSIVSSQELSPLGYTELHLPRPETLRSVRFDGDRAYAITAEQTDPLFTIDLTDPANPAQVGELEMPGWIYHMEPRGDRLLALGFDNAAAEGSLHVSLFDVSDLANPTLLERVPFGGDWSSVAEDQDRIHKAFTILDDLGTILVPFSGWENSGAGDYYCGSYKSGIQLIDFTRDSLTRRGVASARGQARRAFVEGARLFAVSDEAVRTFDIDDRDAPAGVAELALATVVNQSVVVGDTVVRLSADWWTNGARLEVAPMSDPGRSEPVGQLDLEPLFPRDTPDNCYGYGLANGRLFAHGQHVYLVWPSSDWTHTRLATIDMTDKAAPRLAGQLDLAISGYALYGGYYGGSVVASGDTVVQSGSTLVFRRTDNDGYGYGYYGEEPTLHSAWLDLVDLSDPARPTLAESVELPEGAGHTGLRLDGSTVLTSHWVPLPEDPDRARFYFDRIDVANPAAPTLRAPVNVPGSLVSFDSTANRLLTVDYQRIAVEGVTAEACWRSFGGDVQFEPSIPEDYTSLGTCVGMRRAFKLVDVWNTGASLRDQSPIEEGTYLSNMLVGDDRAYVTAYNNSWAEGGVYGYGARLLVVGGLRAGSLEVVDYNDEHVFQSSPLATDGKRLLFAGYNPPALSVLDATDLDNMTFEQKGELSAYVYQVTLSGDRALCSLGHYGLEVIDVGP